MARRPTDEDNGGHGWTFKTLLPHILSVIEANDRRYVEMFMAADKAVAAALAAAEKAVNAALTAANRATEKAEETQRRVNEGQNEFRQQLKDQAATFITRDVLDSVIARLGLVERYQSTATGDREGKGDSRAVLFSVGAIVIALISIVARFFVK